MLNYFNFELILIWFYLYKTKRPEKTIKKIPIKLRRSIYVVEDVEPGEKLTKKNLRIIRPGRGLAPKHYESILGSEVKTKIKRGTALKWEMIKKI